MPPKGAGSSLKAWSEQETFELICKVMFRDGKIPPHSDIEMPGRTPKAIHHVLTNLKKKYYNPDGARTPVSGGESPAPRKRVPAAKKTTPKKRAVDSSDNDEDEDMGGVAKKMKKSPGAAARGMKVGNSESEESEHVKADIKMDDDDEEDVDII